MPQNEFNIFEAIGATRQEVRHSDFLAFLFDPNKNHNLRDSFLRSFLLVIRDGSKTAEFFHSINVNEIILSEVKVIREKDRIDIRIVNESEASPFIIAIENKIDSKEHGEQLTNYINIIDNRYPHTNYQQLFLYLSPDGHEATKDRYLAISYAVIIRVIDVVLRDLPSDSPDGLSLLLRHYKIMLNKHVMIKRLVADCLRKLIQEADATMQPDELYWSNSDRIGFKPKGWESKLLQFYFYNENPNAYGIQLYLYVASDKSRTSEREQIFSEVQNRRPFIVQGGRNDLYKSIYKKDVLRAEDFETLHENEILQKITSFWDDFCQSELPIIQKTIKDIIK